MNTTRPSSLSRGVSKTLASLCLIGLLASVGASAQTTTIYKLDLQPEAANPVADGFIGLAAGVFNGLVASKDFSIGDGLTITFQNFNNYGFGNTANPLVTDGFISSGTNGTSAFSLSGLTPGSTVTVYAIGAWDGPGRAPFVSFNGSAFIDTASVSPGNGGTEPGTTITTSELQLIAQNVSVSGTGILSGEWSRWSNGSLGTGTERAEAQLGGLWIEVTSTSTIPEPSAFAALAGLAILGFAATRRRRA